MQLLLKNGQKVKTVANNIKGNPKKQAKGWGRQLTFIYKQQSKNKTRLEQNCSELHSNKTSQIVCEKMVLI